MTQNGCIWKNLYFIEPAAGDGIFLRYLPRPKTIAVEVDPLLLQKHPDYVPASIENGGFLALTPNDLRISKIDRSNVVFIGNPPFSVPKFGGRSNNVALDFVNHAASMGDTVAMILGNTFRRPTTQSKINSKFHLVFDMDLPQKSFTMDGVPTHVTTIFQIWQAKYDDQGNPIPRPIDPFVGIVKKGQWGGDWKYVKSTDPSANIRLCNWGSHATVGNIDNVRETAAIVKRNQLALTEHKKEGKSMKNYDPDQSHYYICADNPRECYKRFVDRKYLFGELAVDRTMGQNPDLSFADVLRIYLTPVGTHYSSGQWV